MIEARKGTKTEFGMRKKQGGKGKMDRWIYTRRGGSKGGSSCAKLFPISPPGPISGLEL